jgi:putative flippase GtrA
MPRTRTQYDRFREIIIFTTIGVCINIAFLLIFSVLLDNDFSPQTAAAVCYVGALSAGYLLNRSWSFRDKSAIRTTLWKYLVLYAFGYLAVVSMHWSLPGLGMSTVAIQISAILLVMGVNFVVMKYLIFKGRSS